MTINVLYMFPKQLRLGMGLDFKLFKQWRITETLCNGSIQGSELQLYTDGMAPKDLKTSET